MLLYHVLDAYYFMFVLLGKTLPHDSTPLKVAGVTDGSRIMILGKKVNQKNLLGYGLPIN